MLLLLLGCVMVRLRPRGPLVAAAAGKPVLLASSSSSPAPRAMVVPRTGVVRVPGRPGGAGRSGSSAQLVVGRLLGPSGGPVGKKTCEIVAVAF